jgi:hypothetical protein
MAPPPGPLADSAFEGRTAHVTGYTGMGVGDHRFGARTALDHADGRDGARPRLEMVGSTPAPFPPGPWLRVLDADGLGFDS